ncbi:MAG TPA: hypothetical protein VE575_04855, partial [Acidimicrobiales bacterium]|nr:hypothetical protein [Acidimicrobiales bacterium]
MVVRDAPAPPSLAGARLALPSVGTLVRVAAATVGLLAAWRILDAWLPRGMPTGIVVLGMVFGSLYALNAIGLVLIYRANRVINFAQAEFGSVAAVLAIVFVVHWRWNFFLAIATGLTMAAVMGALVESA